MMIQNTSNHLKTNAQGYLNSTADWTSEWAQTQAQAQHLELGGEHWFVIHCLRTFYQEHQCFPPMRLFIKTLKAAVPASMSPDTISSLWLQQLFPQGIAQQLSLIAGLPKPLRCL